MLKECQCFISNSNDPCFSYGKGDKKDESRVSIGAKVCADTLEAVGCNRVVTMDSHSSRSQIFFRIPVENLSGLHTPGDQGKKEGPDNLVVVAAGAGFAEESRRFSRYLDAPGCHQRTTSARS